MLASKLSRLVLCMAVALVALGAVKRVNLKTGGSVVGDLTETETGYEIKTRMGTVTVRFDMVESVEDVVTPQQEYQQRLSQIDPESAQDHYNLGRWAFDNRMLEVAQKELQEAVRLRANYEVAQLLLRQVEARLALEAQAATRPAGPVGAQPGRTLPAGIDPDWLLTDEEISRVRLGELSANDRVRVEFREDVIQQFVNSMHGRGDFVDPSFERRFLNMSPPDKALYMIDQLGRDSSIIRQNVLIRSDPRSLMMFRRQIWPLVASYCSSLECHGSDLMYGGLRLFVANPRDERVDLSNFLLLDTRYGQGKLIDRDVPEDSLLLQYGLPRDQAKFKHPDVEGWRPAHTTRDSANYRRVLDWIDSLTGPPSPEYGVPLRVPWNPQRARVTLPDLPAPTQPADEGEIDLPLSPAD